MRVVTSLSVITLLTACAVAPTAMVDIRGTYDLVSLGSQPVPTSEVSRLWMEVTTQGTWEMFEEPGARFGGTRGIYATGDTLDACYRFTLWPESYPGSKASMDVCPGEPDWLAYVDPAWLPELNLDGPMVFRRRK